MIILKKKTFKMQEANGFLSSIFNNKQFHISIYGIIFVHNYEL